LIFIITTFISEDGISQIDQYSFLNKFPIKEIPVSDSTNLDNFEYKDTLSNLQKRLLHIDKIIAPNGIDFITASVNYQLRLSDKFKTFIISYSPVEYILNTVLANYDSNYNLIDFELIALDENFDNWSRVYSDIKENTIYVTATGYSTGEAIINKRVYSIESNGIINACH